MSGKMKDSKDRRWRKDKSSSDNTDNRESLDVKELEIESQSCGCNGGRCPMRVFGTVDLAPGSEVGLSYGSFVNLVPGTTVGITPGTTIGLNPDTTVYLNRDATVGLTPGTTVGLTPGTTVGITPGSTVTTANNFTTTDIFTPTGTPLTAYTITADGTYYSQPFDVSNYKDYTWYIENATQSDVNITVSPQFAPVNTTTVTWTPVYVPEPSIDGTATQTTVTVAPGSAAVLGGGEQIQYARLAVTVTGLTAGQSVVVRGSIQGSQY